MMYSALQARTEAQHLSIFGAFHPKPQDNAPEGAKTLVLLGPHEPGFWAEFSRSGEALDRRPDPMDRWSKRIICALAGDFGGTAVFPFGGPPYQPFIAWAEASGRAWVSPVGLLVHDHAGLFVSYRGAIALPSRIDLPEASQHPCKTCVARPCLTACPVDALGAEQYDVAACRVDLERAGNTCMERGCAARRACPVSQNYGRVTAQSAFHMSAFK